jgi:hypothetical protein
MAPCMLALMHYAPCMPHASPRPCADNYPNPMTDVDKCNPQRGVPSWICDPDQVLSKEGGDVVEGVIKLIAAGEPTCAHSLCLALHSAAASFRKTREPLSSCPLSCSLTVTAMPWRAPWCILILNAHTSDPAQSPTSPPPTSLSLDRSHSHCSTPLLLPPPPATGERPYAKVPCGGDGYQGHEVGVAVMRRFKVNNGDDAHTAEKFAQALHAKWGVGEERPDGGTGSVSVAVHEAASLRLPAVGSEVAATLQHLQHHTRTQGCGRSRTSSSDEPYVDWIGHTLAPRPPLACLSLLGPVCAGRTACQNGVLLLLSIENRQLYISTGAGVHQKLTWGVLGSIIDEAKPFLKQSKWVMAARGVQRALAGRRTRAVAWCHGSRCWPCDGRRVGCRGACVPTVCCPHCPAACRYDDAVQHAVVNIGGCLMCFAVLHARPPTVPTGPACMPWRLALMVLCAARDPPVHPMYHSMQAWRWRGSPLRRRRRGPAGSAGSSLPPSSRSLASSSSRYAVVCVAKGSVQGGRQQPLPPCKLAAMLAWSAGEMAAGPVCQHLTRRARPCRIFTFTEREGGLEADTALQGRGNMHKSHHHAPTTG